MRKNYVSGQKLESVVDSISMVNILSRNKYFIRYLNEDWFMSPVSRVLNVII